MSIADQLITRGWVQRSFQSEDGVCLMGAAALARGRDTAFIVSEDIDALGRAISDFEGEGGCWYKMLSALPGDRWVVSGVITKWNDDAERTYDEVLRVAKLADEIMEEK